LAWALDDTVMASGYPVTHCGNFAPNPRAPCRPRQPARPQAWPHAGLLDEL